MKVSVIIPTLNEECEIERCIRSALEGTPPEAIEIIVADGGSSDSTRERAQRTGARIIAVSPGRGAQMDAGSRLATGEVFLFLHADTRLPGGWYGRVRECMAEPGTVAGAFTFSVDSPGAWFRVMEKAVGFRSKRYGLVYGDQALFVRQDAFRRAGGFMRLPLMEDVDCVNRLKKLGGLRVLDEKVSTSARRWQKRGMLSTTLRNWFFFLLYRTGASPARLHKWYYGG